MGSMRFQVLHTDNLADGALERVYMTGMDDVPWHSRAELDGAVLVVHRDVSDSGNVHVPWQVEGHGELVLATTCLMEREQSYQLEVELARGFIYQLRSHLAAWETAGLIVPKSINDLLAKAVRRFSRAATSQHEPKTAARHALKTIAAAADLSFALSQDYSEQALAVRRRQTPRLSTLLAVNLGSRVPGVKATKRIVPAFNTAVVPVRWCDIEAAEGQRDWTTTDRQIQWCQKNGLTVCGGPLLQLDAQGIPDWAVLWESDFDSIVRLMIEHVQESITRYQGKVQLWQIASRINTGGALGLTDEQRVKIVARSIEVTRQVDPSTPLVVLFDQPWAEYIAGRDKDLPPLSFADALVRADLGLAGLGLEINAGYHPHGTMAYNPLAYSRLLDAWSVFGLPLLVMLTTPSSEALDDRSIGKSRALPGGAAGELSRRSQRDWINKFVPMILSKNCVQAIIWNQLDDRQQHEFPYSGLFDHSGRTKPALRTLRRLREEYLA